MKHRFLRSWLERIANSGNSGCYVFRQRSGKLIYLRGTDALRVIRQLYVRYTITDMPRAIYVVLSLSIAANLFLVALGSFFLHRRGGMSSIRFRLGSGIELRNVNVASSPRRSLFDTLAHPLADPTPVFLGDSLTQLCEWSELIGGPAINRGIGSDTTADVLSRLDAVLALHPQSVYLMVGFNDLLTNVGSTATIQNYTQIIDRIHTFNPRTIVYVLSVLPTRGQRAGMNQQIKALNQEISNLADNKTIIFVDMYKSFLKGEELSPELSVRDGMHLNGAGYEVWKTNILPFLAVRTAN